MTTTASPGSRGYPSNANLLSCAICDQSYKQPKVLPCLHTFCEQCLTSVIPCESLSVTCPVCRQQSILPVDGVSALQSNVFITNLLTLLAKPDSCSTCGGSPGTPTSKCLDCQTFLCDTCSRNHNITDFANNNSSGSGSSSNNSKRNSRFRTVSDSRNNNSSVTNHNRSSPVSPSSSEDMNGDLEERPFFSGDVNNHKRTSSRDGVGTNGVGGAGGEDEEQDTHNGYHNNHHHIVPLEELTAATTTPSTTGSTTNPSSTSSSPLPTAKLAKIRSSETGRVTIVCPNHSGSELKYYCSHCDTAVCEACTQVEHIGHATVALSEAVTEQKSSLTSLVSRVRQMTPDVERAIEVIEETSRKLECNTKETEDRIQKVFEDLRSLLEARRDAVISELESVSACKAKILQEQRTNLENHLSHMLSLCELTEDSLDRGNDTDVVMVKKEMAGKLQDLLNSGLALQPETNSLAQFDEKDLTQIKSTLAQIGAVSNNQSVPYQTTVGGEALGGCVVGKPTTATVTTRDRNGDMVKTGLAPLQASISSDKTEERLIPSMTDQHNGNYDLTFTLPSVGVYYLTVTLMDQPTKGSPYKIRAVDATELNGSSRIPRTMAVKQKGVKRPSSSRSQGSSNRRTNRIEDDLLMRIGVRGRNRGEFSNPQGLCCWEDKVLVCDSNNQNVQVFAPSGECKLRFGTPGRVPGKLQRPTGVAISQNGNFLVADYDNKWVSVFGPDGKYISRIGANRLQGPKGVCVDKEGRVIVVDNKSSTVLVFQPNGKFLHKFGSRGNRDDQFAGPHYAAVNDQNDVIISDFHNHCVKVFDRDGNFKMSFGSNGEGNGQFNAPTGVAVDDKGNMLVADWGNSRIQVFDSSGSFLSYINCASEPLYGPQGLAVSPQGIIVVADSGNHCIKYYKYLQ